MGMLASGTVQPQVAVRTGYWVLRGATFSPQVSDRPFKGYSFVACYVAKIIIYSSWVIRLV